MAKKKKKWIQGATNPKKKGSYRASVARRHGKAGFVGGNIKNGKIKMSVLNEDIHSNNPTLRHRAQFAKNVQK